MGYVHQAVGDFGSILSRALIYIGDKLGLFTAMAGSGPMTPAQLAEQTGTTERYVREWVSGLAAAGYIDYSSEGRYELNGEQAIVFADETSPAYVMGGFQGRLAATRILPKAVEAFRSGDGIGWHEHDPDLFQGTERFFRPGYLANLVQSWIPALDGAEAKLQGGGKVADIGCGYGASTIVMATAYPDTRFWGFDYHEPSIRHATEMADKAGVSHRVTFEVASAKEYRGTTTTWSVISTACTPWAILSEPPTMPVNPSRTMDTGCSSSRSPMTTSRTTSIQSVVSSIRCRQSSARQPHCLKR